MWNLNLGICGNLLLSSRMWKCQFQESLNECLAPLRDMLIGIKKKYPVV